MQRIDRPWGGRKSLGLFPCLPGLVCQSCGLRRDLRSLLWSEPCFPDSSQLGAVFRPLVTFAGSLSSPFWAPLGCEGRPRPAVGRDSAEHGVSHRLSLNLHEALEGRTSRTTL